jgi:DNA-binding MarR family transcriptional regulator
LTQDLSVSQFISIMEKSAAVAELDSLLSEVNTLATQLKQGRQPFESQRDWSGGVRSVLLALSRQGAQTVPEIGRLRCTSRQNIQIVVNRLKRDGLAELEVNPAHKRSALVRLTEKGRELVKEMEKAEESLLQSALAELSHEQLSSATECLRRLRHLLGGNGTQPDSGKERPWSKRGSIAKKPVVAEEAPAEEESFPVNLL